MSVSNLTVNNNSNRLPIQTLSESQSEWGYGQLFSILLRRKWWVIAVFLGTMALTGVITKRSTPIYQSVTQLLIDSSYTSASKDDILETPEVDVATQVNVLLSSDLIQRAVDKLSVDFPTISTQEIRSTLKVQPVLASNQGNKQNVQTKLLVATFASPDPIKTQKVLDALIGVYRSYNLEQQQKRIQDGLATINRTLPQKRASVIEAEKKLEAFRDKYNVIDPQKESESLAAALNNLLAQRQANQAELQQALANFEVIQGQIDGSPAQAKAAATLSQSEQYQSLLQKLQEKELELAEANERFAPGHPELVELQRTRDELQSLLAVEIQRTTGGVSLDSAPVAVTEAAQSDSTDVLLLKQYQEAQQQIASLQARDRSFAEAEANLTAKLKVYPGLIAQYSRLQPEVEARRAILEKLLNNKEDLSLEISKGGFNWEVVEPPTAGLLISPNVKLNLMLGIVVGLFLGGLTAFIREALDDKVRASKELGNQLSIPLLGTIPQVSALGNRDFSLSLPFRNNGTIAEADTPEIFQWRPLREAMDLTYANIQLLASQNPFHSLMITSAMAGEGKSTLAIGLAISASRMDQRVLLIDADLRRPSLHRLFNLKNEQGLTNLLEGSPSEQEITKLPQWVYMRWDNTPMIDEADGETTVQMPLSDLNIDVLTTGPVTHDPVKLLTVDRMRQIVDLYRDNYDLILVDSAPVLGLVDSLSVGFGCDGVVLIARMDQVKRSEINQTLETLNKLNVIGIIANGVSEQRYQQYARA